MDEVDLGLPIEEEKLLEEFHRARILLPEEEKEVEHMEHGGVGPATLGTVFPSSFSERLHERIQEVMKENEMLRKEYADLAERMYGILSQCSCGCTRMTINPNDFSVNFKSKF